MGVRIKRRDLKTLFDKADYTMKHQVDCAVKKDRALIKVICSDTDAFVLLCTMYVIKNWSNTDVYMEDFIEGKSLISIRKTVEKHKDLIPSLLTVHTLTGCDTVPKMFGIGKGKALNVMKKCTLQCLGDKDTSYTNFMEESKKFVTYCYGMTEVSSSRNRFDKNIQIFFLYSIQNR